jgi:hypothetical protein
MRIRLAFLIGFFVAVAAAERVGAQGFQGGLRGAVRDPNGVVPGAEVTLTNEQTNAKRTTTSNDVGEYAFTNVLPGTYTVRASLPGFKTYENKGIRVGTQEFLTLDLTLEVGALAESVTVTGQSPVIENSNASVASMLDSATLARLPTAGRNPFFLAITTPNVIPTGDPQFVRQQDQTNSSLLSLGGGPRRGNNYTLEGVPITDMRNRAVIIPNIESVEEVKVQVSTYDAEMGRTGGGVFNTVGKSGSNTWHGSALYQNRPSWGLGKAYFVKKSGRDKPESYFHLYGGSFGGPIAKNRTFFWASTEGYQTLTGRNTVLTLPTDLERSGNFSQSGITIYDPLTYDPATGTRKPFEGNIIPPDRLNTVAKNMLQYLPLPTSGKSRVAAAQLVDKAKQATLKLDHRWNDKFTTTGMYGWYDSQEPEARFYEKEVNTNPADPGDGLLLRTVHLITLNNIWVPDHSTVWAFRYGYNQFVDDCVPADFDPSSLGFSQGYLSVIPRAKFPRININGYGRSDTALGDRTYVPITWYSHNANTSFSKFIGRQTIKVGADFRKIGLDFLDAGQTAGTFTFTRGFTSGPNPTTAGSNTGDAFASFLLGLPGSGNIQKATEANMFINYYAAYIQDDFRMTNKLTVNFGLRYEHESGMKEANNNIVVGWDTANNFPIQVAGATLPDGSGAPLTLKGGLMYAGVDGNKDYQGNPRKHKFAPRGGLAYSLNSTTVVRGGYGLFWAPMQGHFPAESAYGTRGFTAVTDYVASFDGGLTPCPGCSLTNPFPGGLAEPVGNAQGKLTGIGGNINFIDQNAASAYVHQYSLDVQKELPRHIAVTVGYVGSRSENLQATGTTDNGLNINQIPTRYQSLGAALNERVTNPFFGTPLGVGILASSTVTRGQLLRPYPQFGNVLARRVTSAKARYNSAVFKFERRISDSWGARVNYTFGRTKDSQWGESNFFSNRTAAPLDVYNLDQEFGTSINDVPHRLNISGTYELPFGNGKRWLNHRGVVKALLGGWAVTGVGTYASGFPISVNQDNNNSGLLGSGQRPNVASGVDLSLGNGANDYDATCSCIRWLNPDAYTLASAFTFGNAPRTDTRVRAPMKKNWDIAFQKTQSVGGTKNVMVRLEVINAFDNPNLLGPATSLGLSTFGRITEVGGFPRLVQLMVRFGF